jgi:hypothetical protein
MARCGKCGSYQLMRLPSSREGKTRWRCLECGNEWYEEKKPFKLIQADTWKSALNRWDRMPSLTALLLTDIEPFADVKRALEGCQRIRDAFAEYARIAFPDENGVEITRIVNEKCHILVSQDCHIDYSLAGRSEKERALIEDETRFAMNAEKTSKYCAENNIEYVERGERGIFENKVGNLMSAIVHLRGEITLLLDVYADLSRVRSREALNSLSEFDDPKLALILDKNDVREKPCAAIVRTSCLIRGLLDGCSDYFIEMRKFLGRISYKRRIWSIGDYYSLGDIIRCLEFNVNQESVPTCTSIKRIDYLEFC